MAGAGALFKNLQKIRIVKSDRLLVVVTNGSHGIGGWDKKNLEYKPQLIRWLKAKLAPTGK